MLAVALAPAVPAADDPAVARAAAAHGREEYVYGIASQAYVYGYPLVEMYRVRDQTVFNPANPRRTDHAGRAGSLCQCQ